MSSDSPTAMTPTINTAAAATVATAEPTSENAPSPPRLSCFFKTEDGSGNFIPDLSNSTEKIFLPQEKGKKSSFLLETEASACYVVEKPPNVVIEYEESDNATFFLGGFQMVSTAKTVEVYLTDLEGKEAYLTTSKGIPFNKEDTSASWFKTICVVPGGPRPISRLRIKMLSLRPTDATTAKLQFMKLTARIAEPPTPMSAATSPAKVTSSILSPNTTPNSGSKKERTVMFAPLDVPESARNASTDRQAPPVAKPSASGGSSISQSDLGAAMAGVSFMARSTEKGIEEALHEQSQRMEKYFGSCFLRMEQQMQFLQRHLVVQQQLIQENNDVMIKQQEIMQDQRSQLQTLEKQQEDMKIRLQSLQADMSVVRYQRLDSSVKISKEAQEEVSQTVSQEVVKPPLAIEIGTKVRDLKDDEDEDGAVANDQDEVDSDGIVDHGYLGEDGNPRDFHIQNVQLKNLIQKTAREIDEQPVSCRPVNCGPMMDHKPLGGCATLPTLDDGVLFKGMMLTDEEMRYQQMSLLRASRGEYATPLPQQGGNEHVVTDDADDVPPPQTTDAYEEDVGTGMDEVIAAKEPKEIEEQNDAFVNIEVTLMEGDQEEAEEEPEEDDAEQESPVQPTQTEVDGDLDSLPVADEHNDFAPASNKDLVEETMLQPQEEKKEMDYIDAPTIQALMLGGEKAAELGTTACTITDSLPCQPKSSEEATL